MLDIAPGLEREFTERAEANGMNADEYLARLLSTDRSQPAVRHDPPPARWYAPAPDHSAESQRVAIHALLDLPREEVIRRNAASIARFDAQLAEAARATPEEVGQANAEWEAHKRSMNEHRAATAELPLFANVAQQRNHDRFPRHWTARRHH
jgi:hypothetical protein